MVNLVNIENWSFFIVGLTICSKITLLIKPQIYNWCHSWFRYFRFIYNLWVFVSISYICTFAKGMVPTALDTWFRIYTFFTSISNDLIFNDWISIKILVSLNTLFANLYYKFFIHHVCVDFSGSSNITIYFVAVNNLSL